MAEMTAFEVCEAVRQRLAEAQRSNDEFDWTVDLIMEAVERSKPRATGAEALLSEPDRTALDFTKK